MLRCGQMAIFQAVPAENAEFPASSPRHASLKLKFVKMATRLFEPRQNEPSEKASIIAEQRRAFRNLIPFSTSPTPEVCLSGVFVTGEEPCWILSTDKEGLKTHSCGFQTVNSFTSCSIWDSKSDFLMHTDEVCCERLLTSYQALIFHLLGTLFAGMASQCQRRYRHAFKNHHDRSYI